jgi:hypothetical protein
MVMTNGTDGTPRKVSSLGELSRNVAPPRDLWPAIAAQISAANESPDSTADARRRLRPTGMQWAAFAAVVAALAVGMWLGRSVLPAGEETLNRRAAQNNPGAPSRAAAQNGIDAPSRPQNGSDAPSRAATQDGSDTPSRPAIEGFPSVSLAANTAGTGAARNNTPAPDPNALTAAFVTDPRYNMQRAAMIRGLETQLKTLPPDTQHKVATSLTAIRTSIQELQEAIGKDPANALLQELLVNSYQDEMRVLTAVQEAGGVSGGI